MFIRDPQFDIRQAPKFDSITTCQRAAAHWKTELCDKRRALINPDGLIDLGGRFLTRRRYSP
jgi:hypothetical protein